MNKKILTIIVLLGFLVPVVYATVWYVGPEPEYTISVPSSFGRAISVARTSRGVTVLFENGDIVVVTLPVMLSWRTGATWHYKIEYQWTGAE